MGTDYASAEVIKGKEHMSERQSGGSRFLGDLEPQKQEWVGLTGVEINHILAANVGYPERMMKDVENLLKEKNSG